MKNKQIKLHFDKNIPLVTQPHTVIKKKPETTEGIKEALRDPEVGPDGTEKTQRDP